MDTDQLFVETINDLQHKVYFAGSEYDLLVASTLMRKLLLDGRPLLHLANRSHRLKLEFEVGDNRQYRETILADRPVVYAVLEGIDPKQESPASQGTLKLSLDDFLAWQAMYLSGDAITVKELILQAANVEGGVHIEAPKGGTKKVLYELNRGLALGGVPAAIRSLKGIGGVIITAAQPLRKAIEESRRSEIG